MFLNSTTARRAGKDPPVYRAGIFRGGGEMPTIIAPDFRGMMYLPKEVPGGSRDDYFPFEGDIAPD